jgi:ribonuclease R
MLPSWIVEQDASLLPGHIRPSINIIVDLDNTLDLCKVDVRIGTFFNRAAISYAEASSGQATIEKDIRDMLILAEAVAEGLFRKRRQTGALAMFDLDRGIATDENGSLVELNEETRFKSYLIVSEMMILANIGFATFAIERDIPIIFRNHVPKLSAPSREEMDQQLHFADGAFRSSFIQKMALWFERADYSTTTKGHFGLNVPAYCHATSPIRRFVDLMNHFIFKDWASASKRFSRSETEAIALDINARILRRKEIRSEISKAKSQAKADDYIKTHQESLKDSLQNLSAKELHGILKQAIRSEKFDGQWVDALATLPLESLLESHFHALIFESPDVSRKHADGIMSIVERRPELAVSALFIAASSKNIGNVDIKVRGSQFATAIFADVDGVTLTTPKRYKASRKQDAKIAAALGWLRGYLENALISASDLAAKIEEEHSQTPEPSSKKEPGIQIVATEPISALVEWATKARVPSPKYKIETAGEKHNPVFSAVVTIEYNGSVLQASGTGSSKTISKRIASERLISQIFAHESPSISLR